MPSTTRRSMTRGALAAAALAVLTGRPVTTSAGQTSGLTQPIKVQGGLVSGAPGKAAGITTFKGIPFARPPVGDQRWRAPQPAAAWQGVRKADAFAASCIQTLADEKKPWTYEFLTHGEISEDCLYLNVWTPARTAAEKRPVLVWIYGGANVEGSGMVPVYDGEGLAAKGIIVVNFNYRVGVLGFFSHPELTKEAAYRASGNYGLLDQIAAVRWVHDNIAAFGGDPARITIAGQSAGGQAIHNLTASPLAAGLFQRAIIESSPNMPGGRVMAEQEADGVRFAQAKGAATLADLRARPWQDIVAPVAAPAPAAGGRGGGNLRFSIVVDGYALPASVREIFAQGKQNDVVTISGATADEGGAVPQPTTTAAEFERQARQRYGELADEFLKLYPAATDAEAKLAQNASARDQARVNLQLWASTRATTAKTRSYTYFWTHALPGPDRAQYGAFHTSEVPYVLNTLARSERPFTAEDHTIADTLSSYWVNFVTNGDPNGKGLAPWPAADANTGMTMEVGDAFRAIPLAGSAEKRAFWEKFLKAQNR